MNKKINCQKMALTGVCFAIAVMWFLWTAYAAVRSIACWGVGIPGFFVFLFLGIFSFPEKEEEE